MKIITSVGTSIFENYFNKNPDEKQLLGLYQKRLKEPNYNYQSWEAVERYIEKLRDPVFKWSRNNQNASAEIKSILAIAQQATNVTVHLLASDTVLSVLAAELVQQWFKKSTYSSKISVLFERPKKLVTQNDTQHIIHQLRVSSNKDYQEGFMNLIEVVTALIEKDKTILNITGGYKAIVPIMTLIGQIKNVPLKYIYEESNLKEQTQLVEVGQLPFSFDWGILEAYANLLFDTSKIQGRKIAELESIGIIKKGIVPIQLTIIGEMLKVFLNQDIPFQKTTLGYLVEYKLLEYYLKNNYTTFSYVELGRPLSSLPQHSLEDADLWMENNMGEIIMVEVKPATIKSRALRKKIEKNLGFVKLRNIKEFWAILYEYSDNMIDNTSTWCNHVISQNLKNEYPNIIFKIKKITIQKNQIDGHLNRTIYHDFMRSHLTSVKDIFSVTKIC